ncbi:protein of unknown function [Pseudodesulfovibrio profundus]|uniref:Portal protein n=1 Tax=Pseudodesulfovibrio profundus TaxID=57320 RepID=A0A2C8FDA7_9BACT|nr:hypothetical protein [Pseudodesulfovibrio profundus]SOB60632.1 protein of unknown function [Pseudodesulfovibrio profundus]
MEKIQIKDSEILDLLSADIDKSKNYAEDRSKLRVEDFKRFRGAPYPGDEQKKAKGWSTTVNTVIANAVNWTQPGLIEVFSDDFFAFKLPNTQQAEALRRYVRKVLYKQQPGEEMIDAFITDCLIYRDGGLVKVYYKEDYDLVTEKYERLSAEEFQQLSANPAYTISRYKEETFVIPAVDEWGQQIVDEFGNPAFDENTEYLDVKAVRKDITFAGPCFEVIPPEEFFRTPEAKTIDDARLCFHQTDRDLNYIRKNEKAGIYRKGSYKKVSENLSHEDSVDTLDAERDSREHLEGLESEINDFQSDEKLLKPNTVVKVREIYTKLDIDGDGLLEPVIVWESCGVVLNIMENPYKRPPFRVGKPFPLPHQWSQDPYPSQLEDDQRIVTNLDRLAQDSAALQTYSNPITNDPQLYKSLLKRGPHTVLQGDPQRIGDASPRGGRSNAILKAKEDAMSGIENKSGITRYNQGLDSNSLNKTLGGMNLIMSAAQQRQRLLARRMGWVFKHIIGDMLKIMEKWPTPEYQQIMQGQRIRLEDIEINVGVSFNEKYQQAMMLEQLVQFNAGPGAQMGVSPEQTFGLIKYKYSLLGIKVDNFLPTQEEAANCRALQQKLAQATKKIEEQEGQLRAERQRNEAAEQSGQGSGGVPGQPMAQAMGRSNAGGFPQGIPPTGPMGR